MPASKMSRAEVSAAPRQPLASAPVTLPVRLENQLCFSVYAASRALTASYRPLLAPLGLTYPQYIVMMALWEQDGISITELGNRVLLDFGTLTPLLKRLEGRGLLTRLKNSKDERQIVLSVTKAGRALQTQAAGVPGLLRCQITLTRSQTAELRRAMTQIIQDLGEAPGRLQGK